MAAPRSDQMNPLEIEIHHLWSRCVRGAYMMGLDWSSGVDRSERREWLESLIEYQASVFAVDIGTFNILSNHFHEVVRNRPDVAKLWSDEEVAWRWRMAWPEFANGRWHCSPTDESINQLLVRGAQDPDYIGVLRGRLANISWLQARVKQPLAWHSNRKDECRGHLWEQRYGNRRLDNEEVVNALLYNDLQQRRAGIVSSVAASEFAAIRRRIDSQARQAFNDMYDRHPTDRDEDLAELEQLTAIFSNCFLAPICEEGPLMTGEDDQVPVGELVLPAGYTFESAESEAAPSSSTELIEVRAPVRKRGRPRKSRTYEIHNKYRKTQRRRASRNPIVGMPWEQYYELLKRLDAQVASSDQRDHGDQRDHDTGTLKEETASSGSRATTSKRTLLAEPTMPWAPAKASRDVLADQSRAPNPASDEPKRKGEQPGGAVGPMATPTTWRAEVKAFAKWLAFASLELPEHLQLILTRPRSSLPDSDTSSD